MAIALSEHAKTESYREYLHYGTHPESDEQFNEAPGIRGIVMLIFTPPGFDRVFKVIKDRFLQKRDDCRPRPPAYQLVKDTTTALGRMAISGNLKTL